MATQDSTARGQAETRAARAQMQAEMAAQAWSDLANAERSRDDNTARLRALRLAREAEADAEAASKAAAKAAPKTVSKAGSKAVSKTGTKTAAAKAAPKARAKKI
ncbi:transcriptional regulator [Methylobacterium aquaticum]|uniref:transcriptional regulator n=1 Tax=Methylobacterium aquaticum TaxID=270351 RepID=UPI001FEE4004|nr:transcriptional regulator [Methylobacterium aquaticum]